MENINLGGLERQPDSRDFQLGAIQAPVSIPASFVPDISWLIPNHQGPTPYCGAHAASHFKAILEHNDNQSTNRFTPRFSWIKIKAIDNFPLEAGTDMRSIFKALTLNGADAFEPLENDVTLPIADYSSPSVITEDMNLEATNHKISSYAFGGTDFQSLCQHTYQNKAVLLLAKVDNGFWGTTTPAFTSPEDGHFFTAYGYDEDYLYIVDSADSAFPFKKIAKQYLTPQFFFESGTALDLPPAVHQALSQGQIETAQQILANMSKILELDIQWIKQKVVI